MNNFKNEQITNQNENSDCYGVVCSFPSILIRKLELLLMNPSHVETKHDAKSNIRNKDKEENDLLKVRPEESDNKLDDVV